MDCAIEIMLRQSIRKTDYEHEIALLGAARNRG